MVAAYRSSVVTPFAGTASFAANMPSGAAVHDRLYAQVEQDSGSQTHTPPAGWEPTPLVYHDLVLDGQSVSVFEKKDASGSEGATQTFTSTSASSCQVTIVACSGCDNAAAVDFATATSGGAPVTSPLSVSGASGTASAGALVLAFVAYDAAAGAATWGTSAWSGSLTEREDASNADWCSSAIATHDNASSGAYGTVTATGTRTAGTGDATWGLAVISVPAAAGAVAGKKSSVAQNAYTGLGI